ncbi:MAG: hypothetical protein ACPGWR_25070 [Ardenticatenaceae bacterium]
MADQEKTKKNLKADNNTFKEDVKKAAIYSSSWTILTAFLSLIPLILIFAISGLRKDINYGVFNAIQDGSLLLFIMAMTTAITVDYHFTVNLDLSQWLKSVIFTLFPFVIGVFIAGFYSILYISDENQINQSILIAFSYIAIVFALIYSFCAKLVIFFGERNFSKTTSDEKTNMLLTKDLHSDDTK